MREAGSIRLLVADDQHLIREGIASVLDMQEGISVVGLATNGREAVALAAELVPDVVLMDVRMPAMDGIEATREMMTGRPEVRVIMLTTFEDDELIVRSLQAGACGYLLKDIPAVHLAEAVRLAHRGIYQLAPEVAGRLVGAFGEIAVRTQTAERARADLTPRELQVLELIATGATNAEIAARLVVSEGTVKNHVSNILGRLGLRDRLQAAIFALENQIFD